MRSLIVYIGVVILLVLAPAASGTAGAHSRPVTLASPSQFDFALDMITPTRQARAPRVSVVGATTDLSVAVAVARSTHNVPHGYPAYILKPPLDSHPGRIFVLIVNRQTARTTEPTAPSLTLRVQSETPAERWTVIENTNVLDDGAPNADCSMLHYFSGPPGAWSLVNAFVVLRSLLLVSPFDGGDAITEIESAINLACHTLGGEKFRRRVRQEPPPVHP